MGKRGEFGDRHASEGWGASDTGESPWRQLQERAQKIQGDKKHIEGMLSQSPCVAQFNSAHKPPGSDCEVLVSGKRVKFSMWFRKTRVISSHLRGSTPQP